MHSLLGSRRHSTPRGLAIAIAALTVTSPSVAAASAPPTGQPWFASLWTTAREPPLQLYRDGLGLASFGDDADAAVAAVSAYLGEPTDDTGWNDPLSISACSGTEVRRVSWGTLSIFLGDDSTFAQDLRHFLGFSYGSVSDFGGEPSDLQTPEGIGIGTSVPYLQAAYPGVVLASGEEGEVDASFFVDDNLRGFLTGTGADDLLSVVVGGDPCAT